ncbi:hypothetical protein [Nocardioides sp. SYSU D00038]|uniref:hypothetical protein n=1 Tax=Nocardioides sp. SYSU D00038 TaxID=2812554 RepID=UPI001968A192|nr:hypothetical protein [Nocardioides sp. SYSU D00038]
MTRGRRVALSLLGLVLLAPAAGGCGGGDDGDGGAGPETPATVTATVTETATPEPTTTPDPTDPTDPTEPTGAVEPEQSGELPVPRTYDDALAHFDAWGSEPSEHPTFVTPSGNIFCVVSDDVLPAGCELTAGGIKDPDACAGAPTDRVGRVELRGGRATPVCNTDNIRSPGAPVLGYGEAARVGGGPVQCLVERIGVTCVHLRRTEGFFLRKGEYVIFNAG